MITNRMSEWAEIASLRYKTLIDGFRSAFSAALNRPDFHSPAAVLELMEQAYQIRRVYLADEMKRVTDATDRIALEALTATSVQLRSTDQRELTDAHLEHLNALESFLISEIGVQIERDIAFLRQSFLRVVLQIRIAARAQRTSLRSAMMEYRIGNMAELHFFFHDRGVRRWPSQKFIRSVWRQHLLNTYNDMVLIVLADHGSTIAEVRSQNPDHQFHGQRVALQPNTSLPSYAEIRAEIFHPNADAILAMPEIN
jgi:hypothetical protein